MRSKIHPDFSAALDGLLFDGMAVMCGGFREAGVPEGLLRAVLESGATDLTLIVGDVGAHIDLPRLAQAGTVRRIVTACPETARHVAACRPGGQPIAELNSPTIFDERIRAAGAGIPAFYTCEVPVGGEALNASEIVIDGIPGFRQSWLKADLAIVKAWRSDSEGNLAFRAPERNFNPTMATAGDTTVVEAELLMNDGAMDGDHVHVPGIFVDRIVAHRTQDQALDMDPNPLERRI